MAQRILIADDEPLYLRTTGELLQKAGYECVCVPDADQAIQRLREEQFDLVLSDLNMPGNLKLELLHEQSEQRPHVPVIVITGVPSLPTAIESIRLGITDYLLKPVRLDDLLSSVNRALAQSARHRSSGVRRNRTDSEWNSLFPQMIGSSRPMQQLFEIIDRVAVTDTSVLITGESGTGKELVARAIHALSHRADGTFQVIDCTAVPESLFESMLFGHRKGAFTGAVSDQSGLLKQCDGGTAFFDELGELPLALQAKLLRAVQEQEFIPVGSHTSVSVDTRFICATNRDLQMDVTAGRFRQDLYYRLGVIHIDLPPLRERGGDILELADYFLDQLAPPSSAIQGFTEAAAARLQQYHWPGNIRELRNVIERTIALTGGDRIDVSDLPRSICSVDVAQAEASQRSLSGHLNVHKECLPVRPGISRDEALKAAERDYLLDLLKQHSGNVSEAARQAGMSRQGMHKLLRQHAIRAAEFRS